MGMMQTPLQLVFHNMAPSPALAEAVRRHAGKLERLCDRIVGCRVVIAMPNRRRARASSLPDVHVVLHVPGRDIAVSRELAHGEDRKSAGDAQAVLTDAFAAAAEQLAEYLGRRQSGIARRPRRRTPQNGID